MEIGLFKDYIGKKIVILGHHNADPDAVGAAIGVKELIENISPGTEATVLMPKDISTLSRSIIDSLSLEVSENHTGSFDTVIIVDTGSLNQLDSWGEKVNESDRIIVIDHHTRSPDTENIAALYLVDEKASSTSEIVHRIMTFYKHKPSIKAAKALLTGIIFDSKILTIGSTDMFKSISGLTRITGDISEVRELFSSEYAVSEKIARLKSAQRMSYQQVDRWIVAVSELGSYHASGARALISLGADVAMVTGEEKKATRSSLRSTSQFYLKTGIHLGELVQQVSKNLDGDGSGHPTAAGFNGNCETNEFNESVLKKIREHLS